MQAFIVNGNPRAGKDTFVELVSKHLASIGIASAAFSSIDPVRDALRVLGVDVSAKTELDRALMAELGASLEKHSLFRSRACLRFILERPEPVKFLYIREPSVMRVLEAMLLEQDRFVELHKLFVSRPDAPALLSNPADAGVRGIRYDIEVSNDAGLEQLDLAAESFARQIAKSRVRSNAILSAYDFHTMARAA